MPYVARDAVAEVKRRAIIADLAVFRGAKGDNSILRPLAPALSRLAGPRHADYNQV